MSWLFLLLVLAPVVPILFATYALVRVIVLVGVAIFALTLLLTDLQASWRCDFNAARKDLSALLASSGRRKTSIASLSPISARAKARMRRGVLPSASPRYVQRGRSPQRFVQMTSQASAHGRFQRARAEGGYRVGASDRVEGSHLAVAWVDLGGVLGKRVCVSLSDERSEHTHLSPVVRQVLLRCAESCERALIDYRKIAGGMVTGRELFGDLLRAIATVRTAADLLDEGDSRRELALRLTAEACGVAAVRCRQAGFDESLLRCAAACDRAADEAELVLRSLAH